MGCTASSQDAYAHPQPGYRPQSQESQQKFHSDGFSQPQSAEVLPPPPTLLTERFRGENKQQVQFKHTLFMEQQVDYLSTSLLSYMQNALIRGTGPVGGYISNVQGLQNCFEPKGCRTIGEADVDFTYQCQKGGVSRRANQDAWCMLNIGPELRLMVVADGFGKDGHMVADLAVELLPKLLLSTGKMRTEWNHACFHAFLETHRMLVKLGKTDGWDSDYSGCSAAMALYDREDRVVRIASTGHCAICTGRADGSTGQMWTEAHTGALGCERERLQEAGAKVHWDGFYNRVYCPDDKSLTIDKCPIVSRCLCHNYAHRMLGVIATPEVAEFPVSEEHQIICMTSRGVWEYVELDDIMHAIGRSKQTRKNTAEFVISHAHQAWLADSQHKDDSRKISDLTAVCMYLK